MFSDSCDAGQFFILREVCVEYAWVRQRLIGRYLFVTTSKRTCPILHFLTQLCLNTNILNELIYIFFIIDRLSLLNEEDTHSLRTFLLIEEIVLNLNEWKSI